MGPVNIDEGEGEFRGSTEATEHLSVGFCWFPLVPPCC